MKELSFSINKYTFFILFFIGFILVGKAQIGVPFSPRLPDGNIKVKGDLILLSNNILNFKIAPTKSGGKQVFNPNEPYNDRKVNNQHGSMGYIDIDGDSTTFSSSSAWLNTPNCSRIIYAGLYWGGTYPFNAGYSSKDIRDSPYEYVKFKIPGGSYVDIGPNSDAIFDYDRIYDKQGDTDGDGKTDPGLRNVDSFHSPYLNYANVTHLLAGLGENPNGEYIVANVVGTLGKKQGGSLAGWTMVIVYENPNSISRYISTFDGLAAISPGNSSTFSFRGFKTLPAPLPVKARIGVSAMEGDALLEGPQLSFKAKSSNSFTILSNSKNPETNFFNSTITDNDEWVDTRNPASKNTLGWDTDILNLLNPANTVLPNDETEAEINIKLADNTGDITYMFLNTLSVDVIEPEIIVEKRVQDISGKDITGKGVSLGQNLDYVFKFKNKGNDDATNFTLRDVLPANTSYMGEELIYAPGTTITQDDPSNPRIITFHIPNNLVEKGDPSYTIRMRIKISSECNDFVNACSSIIKNVAYSTYRGVLNTNIITDDPSVSSLSVCGNPNFGTTNFLLDDISSCNFKRNVQLCGDDVILYSGRNYEKYLWVRDLNGNNQVDTSDQTMNDGDPDNDPSTLKVTTPGTYIVNKSISSQCSNLSEIITVTRFGDTQNNPIADWFNTLNQDTDPTNNVQGEIVTCSTDGSLLTKIFLCGSESTQDITLNITDVQNVVWEKLVSESCSDSVDDCANKNSICSWNQVKEGSFFSAKDEGKYRVIITYLNGCSNRFYFNVFKNSFEPQFSKTDLICTNPGNITITNIGSDYGFRLVDVATESILIPYSANNGSSFNIESSGAYRVDITQLDATTGDPIDGACEFSTPEIGILNRQLQITTFETLANCNLGGDITIHANNVRANYTYELYYDNGSGAAGMFIDDQTAHSDNNFTFKNLNPGDYVVVTKTVDGCEDSSRVRISKASDFELSAVTKSNIACSNGSIELTATGGFPDPDYSYAIWSKDEVSSYSSILDIPSTEFQTSPIFTMDSSQEGIYTFVAVDSNNCFVVSNKVTISNNTSLVLGEPTLDTPISCSATNSASITINTTGGTSPFVYSIDDGATTQSIPIFVGLSAGVYALRVTDASGCDATLSYAIADPDSLTAFAGISSDGSCSTDGSSEVRFTNVTGGVKPYKYSFDGINFSSDVNADTANLMPGEYVLVVRDARGCRVNIPTNSRKSASASQYNTQYQLQL